MNDKEKGFTPCDHTFAPLGFEMVQTDETKIEVIAAVFCTACSMFRTKILYFDRQHDKNNEKA